MDEIKREQKLKSDAFEIAMEEANTLLVDEGIRLEYNFIEDYVSDDGEFAYTLTVVRMEELKDDNQLDLL